MRMEMPSLVTDYLRRSAVYAAGLLVILACGHPAASAQNAAGSVASSSNPTQDGGTTAVVAAQPASEPAASAPPARKREGSGALGHVGIGIKVSTLGAGLDLATPLSRRSNARVGVNAFNFSKSFTKDGVNYGGQLRFLSIEAHYDWFPLAGSFHLSPGLLAYNGNQIKATGNVPGGQTFTLGGVTYTSDPTRAIAGNGLLQVNKVAPTFMVGWGNLLPRGGKRHFSVPFEVGAAFQGSPKVSLNLNGNVCDSTGLNCRDIATDPTAQANIVSEQNKLNKSASPFKVYPVISMGFGYSF